MIYLDNNATTRPLSSIAPIVARYLGEEYGNPSSVAYELGRNARVAVDNARVLVSQLVDCDPEEVIFTSGGTESIFISLLGAARSAALGNKKIVLSPVEHPAVLEATKTIEEIFGFTKSELNMDRDGALDFSNIFDVAPQILSIMYANNETGIINPVLKIGEKKRTGGVLDQTFFQVDTVQYIGKLPFSFQRSGFDAINIAAHKLYGPKGVGALIIKKDSAWLPFISGGGQERGRRGGTENVALIAAFGEAARVAKERLDNKEEQKLALLRTRFEEIVQNEVNGVSIIGRDAFRLPNTSALIVSGIFGYEVVEELGKIGICISSGSACKSGKCEPSKNLTKMGYSLVESMSLLRVSFGFNNTIKECEEASKLIAKVIKSQQGTKNKILEDLLNG